MVKFLPVNPFSRPGEKLSSVYGIVWHWVGNAGKGVDHTARYFEILGNQDPNVKEARYASSHFIIDEKDWLQVIPLDEVAYHAGARWWNKNTIGIEICHKDWTGKFEAATLDRLCSLTAYLMDMFDVKRQAIYRHYDITGKLCPKYFVENNIEYEETKRECEKRLHERYFGNDRLGDIKKSAE